MNKFQEGIKNALQPKDYPSFTVYAAKCYRQVDRTYDLPYSNHLAQPLRVRYMGIIEGHKEPMVRVYKTYDGELPERTIKESGFKSAEEKAKYNWYWLSSIHDYYYFFKTLGISTFEDYPSPKSRNKFK